MTAVMWKVAGRPIEALMTRIAVNRRLVLLLAYLPALAARTAPGQPQSLDADTLRLCAAVKDVELPSGDRPTRDEETSLAHCVSSDLYFGFGQPADPVKARACAFAEMKRGGSDLPFGGRTILMMLYANGKGVARNFDVALKLACEIGGAPMDVAGRVHELAHFRDERWTGDTFSTCDHSAGTYMYEQCAILQERFDGAERDLALNAIVSKWSAANRRAFDVFHAKARAFFKARAGMEIDLDGTLEVHETAFLERDLISTLERFERGELPKFPPGALRAADSAMKAALDRIRTGTRSRWGTATREGIRQAQLAWLDYRDAWVAFGRRKYPGVAAESWKTWLTEQRVGMLGRFAP
jgi:hypothetical protein